MDTATGMKEATDRLVADAARLDDAAFVAACRDHIRDWGTLPQPLPAMRRDAMRRLRQVGAANGQKVGWLARQLGFTPNRFSRLTRSTSSTEVAA